MRFFGISDLHLSFQTAALPGFWQDVKSTKAMDIFGAAWQNHFQKIFENWQSCITAEDVVLMPGDTSWAMRLNEVQNDLAFLGQLPGQIVLCRGNHDYWWQGLSKIKSILPPNLAVLQHSCLEFPADVICGQRGWLSPGHKDFSAEDQKIFLRECLRLQIALEAASACQKPITVICHFRPTNDKFEHNDFIQLMLDYGVKRCVYGHLHGKETAKSIPKGLWPIEFNLVSCDYLDFKPVLLWQR